MTVVIPFGVEMEVMSLACRNHTGQQVVLLHRICMEFTQGSLSLSRLRSPDSRWEPSILLRSLEVTR